MILICNQLALAELIVFFVSVLSQLLCHCFGTYHTETAGASAAGRWASERFGYALIQG